MTLPEFGATPAQIKPLATATRFKPSGFHQKHQVTYLSWNAGSLTTAAWEGLLSVLKNSAYQSVKIVAIQETQ